MLFHILTLAAVEPLHTDSLTIRPAFEPSKHFNPNSLEIMESEAEPFDRVVYFVSSKNNRLPATKLFNKNNQIVFTATGDRPIAETSLDNSPTVSDFSFLPVTANHHWIINNGRCLKIENQSVITVECPKNVQENYKDFEWIIEVRERDDVMDACKRKIEREKERMGGANSDKESVEPPLEESEAPHDAEDTPNPEDIPKSETSSEEAEDPHRTASSPEEIHPSDDIKSSVPKDRKHTSSNHKKPISDEIPRRRHPPRTDREKNRSRREDSEYSDDFGDRRHRRSPTTVDSRQKHPPRHRRDPREDSYYDDEFTNPKRRQKNHRDRRQDHANDDYYDGKNEDSRYDSDIYPENRSHDRKRHRSADNLKQGNNEIIRLDDKKNDGDEYPKDEKIPIPTEHPITEQISNILNEIQKNLKSNKLIQSVPTEESNNSDSSGTSKEHDRLKNDGGHYARQSLMNSSQMDCIMDKVIYDIFKEYKTSKSK